MSAESRQTYLRVKGAGWCPSPEAMRAAGLCAKQLDCGGLCVLDADHLEPCECIGDEPGQPDSCPA